MYRIRISNRFHHTSSAVEKNFRHKELQRWNGNGVSTSAMALRLSIPETNQGTCGAGTAKIHSGGLILTHSAIVQRPLRVESFDVNFEMLLDHSKCSSITC